MLQAGRQDSSSPTATEVEQLLDLGEGVKIHEESDSYGYRWAVIADDDFGDLINEVHVVNTTLEDHGWGPQLLCSVFAFAADRRRGVRPGSRYGARRWPAPTSSTSTSGGPSIPSSPSRRRNGGTPSRERLLQVTLATDLAMEPDLERWFPLWGLPVH